MSAEKGDWRSIGTAGWSINATGGGVSAVATCGLIVADDGTGTSVTATISGADAGVTYYLYYAAAAGPLVQGSSRSGDGVIAQAGLTAGVAYTFVAVGETTTADVFGGPSNPVALTLGRSGGAARTPSGRTPTHLFRHHVDIEEPTESTAASGSTTQSYAIKAGLSGIRCMVDDSGGSESVRVSAAYGSTTVLIYMARLDVEQRDRVKWIDETRTTRYFDIVSIVRPNHDPRLMVLHCQATR